MAKIRINKNEDGSVTISTQEQAMTAAYFAASKGETSDFAAPLFKFSASLHRVTAIGRCETREEAKLVLGEALLWYYFQEFLFAHDARNNYEIRGKVRTAFNSNQWNHRGADADIGQFTDALECLRVKAAKFCDSCVRYCATSPQVRERTGALLIAQPAREIVHDTSMECADLRTVMNYLKLSPRECMEAAVAARAQILEAAHDALGAQNDKRQKKA